jgi:hypothetical protein
MLRRIVNGWSELTTTALTADEVRNLVEHMLKSTGRRIDFSTPFVNAMLLDGSRLRGWYGYGWLDRTRPWPCPVLRFGGVGGTALRTARHATG